MGNRFAGIQSAEAVAALRAVVSREKNLDVPCEDPFARHFLETKYRWLSRLRPHPVLKQIVHAISPGSYCFAITRTRHFDEILMEEAKGGIEQLVVLGAGFDSRALRFKLQLSGVHVFEVDHPETQAYKRRILARIPEANVAHVRFVPIDFNRQALDSVLQSQGFVPEKKTLFLWEGVSYYIQPSKVQELIAFVSRCVPGSSIVFDYSVKGFVNGDFAATYGGREVGAWLKKIGERFIFGLDAHETESFLAACGLQLVSDLGPSELDRRYLRTRKNKSPLGRSLGHVRMAHAKVTKAGT